MNFSATASLPQFTAATKKVVQGPPPARNKCNFDFSFSTRSSRGTQSAGAGRRVEAEPHLALLAAA